MKDQGKFRVRRILVMAVIFGGAGVGRISDSSIDYFEVFETKER